MAIHFDEVKSTVKSVLTSSKKKLTIQELEVDFKELEGFELPFREMGCGSIVELLLKMDDVLSLPPHPNGGSIINLIVGEKVKHIRDLIDKQKNSKKNKKTRKKSEKLENDENNDSRTVKINLKDVQNLPDKKDDLPKKNQKYQKSRSYNDFKKSNIDIEDSRTIKNLTGVQNVPDKKDDLPQTETNKSNTIALIDKKAEKSVNESNYIPKEKLSFEVLVVNIANIFKVYDKGVHINNLKYIYNIMYHSKIYCTSYGFTSIRELLKLFDEMIDMRNNVLYTIDKLAYSRWYRNHETIERKIKVKNNSELMIQRDTAQNASLKNNLKVSLKIEGLFDDSQLKNSYMVLIHVYNTSFFYVRTMCSNIKSLEKQMQVFYDNEPSKCHVQSDQILPGSIYVIKWCFEWHLEKQFYRVRVLDDINANFVQVFFVDYGYMEEIPKSELRFLKYEFSKLPYQAIYCCLTGYNTVNRFKPRDKRRLLSTIDNEPFTVKVDGKYNLNEHCQVYHVTLFKRLGTININEEIDKLRRAKKNVTGLR